MEIKRLYADNMAAIIAFDKLCFPSDCGKEKDWKDLLEDSRAFYYAAMDSGKIVGDVFVYNWNGERDYVKVMNLAVHPDYRNRHLAYRLLDYAAGEMAKTGMRRFCGETRASNVAMQRVFCNCSYILNEIAENYYDNPIESAYKYVLQK